MFPYKPLKEFSSNELQESIDQLKSIIKAAEDLLDCPSEIKALKIVGVNEFYQDVRHRAAKLLGIWKDNLEYLLKEKNKRF